VLFVESSSCVHRSGRAGHTRRRRPRVLFVDVERKLCSAVRVSGMGVRPCRHAPARQGERHAFFCELRLLLELLYLLPLPGYECDETFIWHFAPWRRSEFWGVGTVGSSGCVLLEECLWLSERGGLERLAWLVELTAHGGRACRVVVAARVRVAL